LTVGDVADPISAWFCRHSGLFISKDIYKYKNFIKSNGSLFYIMEQYVSQCLSFLAGTRIALEIHLLYVMV